MAVDGFEHWSARSKWNASYFRETMAKDEVTVAMTPNGLADSIVDGHFVQPYQCKTRLSEMLEWLDRPCGHVRYLQLQNGSLNLEFQKLREDVDADGLDWAREVLGEDCLTNIWIGNHLSTTSIHHDPYENLYCQILGSKKFTLYPPQEYYLLNEETYPTAHYTLDPANSESLVMELDDPPNTVPWLTPSVRPHELARPFEVILEPGETLYLPALWFHQVEQIDDAQGLCVAVNYWYDLDYMSPLWVNWKFMRKISMLAQGRLKDCENELIEEETI